ncbi:MAG: HD domain-containing protein, partial [Desulfovibrionaceae bacterium]|nr:HD domain-containing protein [Desulfovibrionaceae bacterium]
MFVKDITQANQQVEGLFLISDVCQLSKVNGEHYWSFNLNDASGAVPAKRWPSSGCLTPAELADNSYVQLQGVGSPYRDKMQVRVDHIRVLSPAEAADLDQDDFTPPSRYSGQLCLEQLMELMDRETAGTIWHELVHAFFDVESNAKAFAAASAARYMHHVGKGGLAAHTLEVCRTCAAVADVYEDLDRPALMTGALFHDIGKLQEMESDIVKTVYTVPGKLMGHIVLGVIMLQPYCDQIGLPDSLREHLFHLLLSHHGIEEYGAVKRPATREALILSQADMISAKLSTMAEAMQNLSEGSLTPKDVFGLNGPVYCRVTTEHAMNPSPAEQKTEQARAAAGARPVRTGPASARDAGSFGAGGFGRQLQRKSGPGAEPATQAGSPAITAGCTVRKGRGEDPAARSGRPRRSPAPARGHEVPPWEEDGYLESLREIERPPSDEVMPREAAKVVRRT